MAFIKRPYNTPFDNSGDIPIQTVGDDPANLRFLPAPAVNARTIFGGDQQSYVVGDVAFSPRGSKNVIWSSEGYTTNGYTVPALTAVQKRATGSANTNIALATFAGTSTLLATPPSGVLDFSPYRAVVLMVNLSAITGTSIQYELDTQDDSGTPVVLPLWKPAALIAAGSLFTVAGTGVAFDQAAAAAATAPSASFAVIAVPTGWTYALLPFPFAPNGNFQWTAVALTVATWTAWLYGIV